MNEDIKKQVSNYRIVSENLLQCIRNDDIEGIEKNIRFREEIINYFKDNHIDKVTLKNYFSPDFLLLEKQLKKELDILKEIYRNKIKELKQGFAVMKGYQPQLNTNNIRLNKMI